MGGKKNLSIVFLFLIILCSFVTATANEEYYFQNNNYRLGTGLFNQYINETYTSTVMTNPRYAPQVADLDGDGESEIIVWDDYDIKIFNKTLGSIASQSLLQAGRDYTNFVINDIDNDGYKDIIIASMGTGLAPNALDNITIIEYNGTGIGNVSTMLYDNIEVDEAVLSCDPDTSRRCIILWRAYSSGNWYAAGFNDTSISVEHEYMNIDNYIECLPLIPILGVGDPDGDGTNEFFMTFTWSDKADMGAADQFRVRGFKIGSDLTITNYLNISQVMTGCNVIDGTAGSIDSCNASAITTGQPVGRYISSPLIADVSSSAHDEIITAGAYSCDASNDNYRLWVYKGTGDLIDTHPESTEAEGTIISNPALFNAFTDSGTVDYCVMGYDDENELINLLCGSRYGTNTILGLQTEEFKASIADEDYDYNINYTYWRQGIWTSLIHAGDHDSTTEGGTNLDEVVTPYGTFRLDINFLGGTNLIPLFRMDKQNSSIVGADIQEEGYEDFIALTKTNLWYVDDGQQNTPGYISKWCIDPQPQTIWEINTSVHVYEFQVSDLQNDQVSARAILYWGSDNYQDSGWTINTTAGTTFSFVFTANITGPGTLRLIGRDVENPNTNDTKDYPFTVSTQGIAYGDGYSSCQEFTSNQTQAGVAPPDDPNEPDLTENTITQTLIVFEGAGLISGMGYTLTWLLILVSVIFYIWTGGFYNSPVMSFGVVLIVTLAWLIMGVKLGFIGTGIVISFVVVGIVIVGVFVRMLTAGE